MASFWSDFCYLEEGARITMVDIKVNYLAPVRTGKLTEEGKRIKIGKSPPGSPL
jgi:acyl-coenzyme A thioesterase PaaI-like protein